MKMAPRKNENFVKIEKRVGKVSTKKTPSKSPTLIRSALPNTTGRRVRRNNPCSVADEVAHLQLMRGVTSVIVEEPQQLVMGTRTRKKGPNIVSGVTEEPDKTTQVHEIPKKEMIKKAVNKSKKTNASIKKKIRTKTVETSKELIRKRPLKTTAATLTAGVSTRSLRNKKSLIQESNENCEVKLEENKELIKNRRFSTTSHSNLSWTKDISSSSVSTMLAVSSNDYVCIDNKMPVLSLSNIEMQLQSDTGKFNSNDSQIIDRQIKENKRIEPNDDTSSSSSCSSSCSNPSTKTSSNIDVQSLNLSKSTDENPHERVLNTINELLTQIDLTDINWESSAETIELDFEIQNKIKNELDFERSIKTCCRQLFSILDDNNESHPEDDNTLANAADVTWQTKSKDGGENKEVNKFAIFTSIDTNKPNSEELATVDKPDCVKNKKVLYDSYDDDAVSLDTESITGIESSGTSVHEPITNPNENEMERDTCSPYVPQPLSEITPCTKRCEYQPTKIETESVKRIVCEKQNADSTSINKDPDIPVSSSDNDSFCNTNKAAPQVSMPVNNTPQLIASMFKGTGQFFKSIIFRDVCIFNVMNNCNNNECRYSHIIPDLTYVLQKLTSFSDERFIIEYLAIRNWLLLKQKYGIYFVNEAKHRNLTRLLLEMVIDFSKYTGVTGVDEALQVEVVESVLLHLNDLDLMASKTELEDLLMYEINSETRLCDLLMQNIADTQNFSRFKSVFLNLTYFIVQHGGTFPLYVAEHLLERICILPSETSLYYALYDIVTRTDIDIFKNKMISIFENNLSVIDFQRFEKLIQSKNESCLKRMDLNSPFGHSAKAQKNQDTECNIIYNDKERYTSPDTTNVETNNQMLPVIKRTIAFNPNTMSNTPSSDVRLTKTHQKWPNNKFQQKFNFSRAPRPVLRSLMDPRPMFRSRSPFGLQRLTRPPIPQRQVTYRPIPPNFMMTRPPRNYE